jgi:hypothetical protein
MQRIIDKTKVDFAFITFLTIPGSERLHSEFEAQPKMYGPTWQR